MQVANIQQSKTETGLIEFFARRGSHSHLLERETANLRTRLETLEIALRNAKEENESLKAGL